MNVAIAVAASWVSQREATVRELEHQYQAGERGLHRGADHRAAPTRANAPTGVPGTGESRAPEESAEEGARREEGVKTPPAAPLRASSR